MFHRAIFFTFFLLVLTAPFLLLSIKLALGAILILIQSAYFRSDYTKGFDSRVSILVMLGLLYVLVPHLFSLNNNGSFIYVLLANVIFVTYWWLFLRSLTFKDISRIVYIATISAWIIWVYALALLLDGFGYIPFDVPDIYERINVDTRSVGLSSNAVSALLFLAPILTVVYLYKPTTMRYISLVIFWIGVIALGRRSAFFGLAIAIGLLAFESTSGKTIKKGIVWAVVPFIILFGGAFYFDLVGLRDLLSDRLSIERIVGESARMDQAEALLLGFADSPFFGNGLGAIADLVRSTEKPWRYELSYVAALFRFGIIGCMLLTIIYGSAIFSCLRDIRTMSVAEKALFAGSMSQFVAYAVNPVFDTFDTGWQILIPILLASRNVKHERPSERSRPVSGSLAFGSPSLRPISRDRISGRRFV